MADRPPCALAYGGNWPDGSVYQCARCMAKRHFWRGRSIVRSSLCDGENSVDKDRDLASWRALGPRDPVSVAPPRG